MQRGMDCGPSNEAIEPLRAREAEKLECRVTLEEVGVRDDAAGGLEVEPAFGGHGRREGGYNVWLCCLVGLV